MITIYNISDNVFCYWSFFPREPQKTSCLSKLNESEQQEMHVIFFVSPYYSSKQLLIKNIYYTIKYLYDPSILKLNSWI